MKKNYPNSSFTRLILTTVLTLISFFNSFAQTDSYCVPTNTVTDEYYITGITTTGGETNFSNTGTGFNGGYSDYTASYTVSTFPGGSFSVTATHASDGYLYGGWVDWNRDFVFSDDELFLYTGRLISPAFLGTVIAPADIAPGAYRLRIRSVFSGLPMPCEDHAWGEAEDYTINIVDITACFPPYGLSVMPTSDVTKADLIWSHPVVGAEPLGYEYVFSTVPTAPTGSGTTIAENYVFEATYDANLDYYLFVRTICGENDFSPWESLSLLKSGGSIFRDNDIIVYKDNNGINISCNDNLLKGVAIYDTSGRKLYNKTINNVQQATINGLQLQQQVLIVEINTLKGKVIKRIVF